MKPKVSIIIPNYNCSKYIDECVQSVFRQTYQNLEVVILDNETAADTSKIVRKYQSHGLRVCRNTSTHQRTSCNLLTQTLTEGKYMMLLSPDDRLYPAFVERAVELMEQYVNVGYVQGESNLFTDEEKVLLREAYFDCSFISPGREIMSVYMRSTPIHKSQIIFRRSAFEKIDGYDMQLDDASAAKQLCFYLSAVSDFAYIREAMCEIFIGKEMESYMAEDNMQRLLSCHLAIKEFVKFAKTERIEEVYRRESKAYQRLAEECLICAAGKMLLDQYQEAAVYLQYCKVISHDIQADSKYMQISEMLKKRQIDRQLIQEWVRNSPDKQRGYEPPWNHEEIRLWEVEE